jgi:uncharacterized protein (TIGR00369 family)
MLVQPANPDFREKVASVFRRQPFMAHIGARLRRVEPGFCEIDLPFRPELGQQHDYLHAGVVATLIDNAAGFAALSLFEAEEDVLSVEYKLNLLRPLRGGRALGRGKVIRCGRRISVCEAEVWERNEKGEEQLCAKGMVTLMRMSPASDTGTSEVEA